MPVILSQSPLVLTLIFISGWWLTYPMVYDDALLRLRLRVRVSLTIRVMELRY